MTRPHSLSLFLSPSSFYSTNKRCAYQQQQKVGVMGLGFVATAAVEMRRGGDALVSLPSSDGVVCPKPRRIGLYNCPPRDLFRPSPLLLNNQQMEAYDAKAGNELFDIILNKGAAYGAEKPNFQVALSPPFFSGSPPTRASNPVIQDEQFGNSKLSPLMPVFEPSSLLIFIAQDRRGGMCPHQVRTQPYSSADRRLQVPQQLQQHLCCSLDTHLEFGTPH